MSLHLTQGDLVPVIRDIVHAQLQQASPARFGSLRRSQVPILVALRNSDLDIDSLELIRVGNAVANFFNLRDAGVEDLLLTDTSIAGFAKVVNDARTGYSDFQIDTARDFTFASSGSTGKSTFWRHHESWLNQEIQYWNMVLSAQPSKIRRIVACVPRCHVYGFIWTVLLPKALGIDVVELFPEQLFAHKLKTGDLVVATPSIWSVWDSLEFTWPSGILGVSSTAPLSRNIAQSLAKCGLPIIEIYGSTENAGIAARHPGTSNFELITHFSFNMGDEMDLIRHCPDGVSRKFTLLDNVKISTDKTNESNSQFIVTGRKDHVVQINGYNVSTQWIALQVKSIQGISDCAVRKMNPHEGEYLKVCLVINPNADEANVLANTRAWCDANLPTNARPKHYHVAAKLPHNEIGKLTDWPITFESDSLAIGLTR